MGRARHYILMSFTRSFMLIFIPFFIIVSIIFIIKISYISSQINLKAYDLLELFSYFVPEIFFYTIPLSVIAALSNTVSRLSDENELLALFALGHSPKRILFFLLPSIMLFSAFMLTISLLMLPQAYQKIQIFKDTKTSESSLNIEPNRLCQNFGRYHIFAKEKKDKYYRDVVLFEKQNKNNYRFLLARKGSIENNNSVFTFKLFNGIEEDLVNKNIRSLKYRRMNIFQQPNSHYQKLLSNQEYWKRVAYDIGQRRKMMFFIFMSLSPLIIFGVTVSLSIYNPRYQKSFSTFAILIAGLIIYIPALILQKEGNIYLFGIFAAMLLFLDIFLLKRKIFKYY